MRTILIVFAIVFCAVDTYLIASYGGQAADEIGWGWIAGALLTQAVTAIVGTIGIVRKIDALRYGREKESVVSYRHYIPVMTLGVVLAGLALSTDLLHIGIVCPDRGMPAVRGHPACS